MQDKYYQRDWGDGQRVRLGDELVVCKICGREFQFLGSHIAQVHGMDTKVYKLMFGLDTKKGLISPGLRQRKKEIVYENDTIKNLDKGREHRFKKGDPKIGKYKRSDQTRERLTKQLRRIHAEKNVESI